MSTSREGLAQSCPKCGGPIGTQQRDNVLVKYCDHCGPHAWGKNVKTGKPVKVAR